MAFHFQPAIYEAWPGARAFEPLFSRGDSGVPLFFVLSGFIIWHNYGFRELLRPRASVRFLWRRIARLWPVNLFTVILAIPVVWFGVIARGNWGAPVPEWYSKVGWLQSAFMVQEIGKPDPVFSWNQPAWSLSAEMVAYVVFPGLLALLIVTGVTRTTHTWVWAVLALVIAYGVEDKQWLFPFRWLLELILMFAAGALMRLASVPGRRLRILASIVQIAAPAAIVLVCFTQGGQFIVVLLLAWIWSLSSTSGPGVWFFSLRGMQTAGLSSYSLYMTHWVIFGYGYIFLFYFPVVQEHWMRLYVIIALVLVAAASWVMWKFYETPARKLLNHVFERVWRKKPVFDTSEPLANADDPPRPEPDAVIEYPIVVNTRD